MNLKFFNLHYWLEQLCKKQEPFVEGTRSRRRRPIPTQIERYYIPRSVYQATMQVMRRFGEEQRECYVWWAGYFDAHGNGQVITALYPEVATEFGRVYLDRQDLARLSFKLRRFDQILLIELHSHPPGAGGQNDVDAAHPAINYRGFTTVVVPDFGAETAGGLQDMHIYEYEEAGEWRQLGRQEIQDRFLVEETLVAVEKA